MSDDEEVSVGKRQRKRQMSRSIYGQSYFGLAKSDLVAMAKSRISVAFMKEFNSNFKGEEIEREDALITALGRIIGLEPFALTQSRLPGVTVQMAKDQQTKLRDAARNIQQSFNR